MTQTTSGVRTTTLDGDAPDLTGSLVLRNDGDHWVGTFHIVLRTLLDDLLPEGPINVQITHLADPPSDGTDETRIRGRLASLDARDPAEPVLIMDDGYRVRFDQVLAIAL